MTREEFAKSVDDEVRRLIREADKRNAEKDTSCDSLFSPECDKLFEHTPYDNGDIYEQI